MRKRYPRGEQARHISTLVRDERSKHYETGEAEEDLPRRPTRRGECLEARGVDDFGAPNPCPFVSCRYHLYLDVRDTAGAIAYGHPTVPVEELERLTTTCALDVADNGPKTLRDVAHLLGVSRKRVRQIQEVAVKKYRLALLPLVSVEERKQLRLALANNAPLGLVDAAESDYEEEEEEGDD